MAMVTRDYSFTLDVINRMSIPRMEFVQGDYNTCILNINLTENDVPINLTDLSVDAVFKKPDNNVTLCSVDIVNALLGQIKCVLTTQTLAVVGEVKGTINIHGTDQEKLTSAEFKFKVRESFDSDDAIESTSEFSYLVQITNEANNLVDNTKTIGEYNSTTPYKKLNRVTFQGSSYEAKQDTVDNAPTFNAGNDYWYCIAKKGDRGDQGLQGVQGIQGVKGDTGNQGIQGVKGDTGATGVGLNYNWSGTQLGVKREDEVSYIYTNLQGVQGIQGLKGDKGDKGDQGIQGVQGLKGDKGDRSINWINTAYNNTKTYNVDDALYYNGSSYHCILQSVGHLPTDTTYWQPISIKGSDGLGSGDMMKADFDPDNDGKVEYADNADMVNNHTVLKDVPADAVFTDTVYVHPETHSADMITDGVTNKVYTSTEKTKLSNIVENSTKVEASVTNGNIKINNIETTVYTHPDNHDNRYYTETEVDSKLSAKSDSGHTHETIDITDFPTIPTDTSQLAKSDVYTKTEVDNKIGTGGSGSGMDTIADITLMTDTAQIDIPNVSDYKYIKIFIGGYSLGSNDWFNIVFNDDSNQSNYDESAICFSVNSVVQGILQASNMFINMSAMAYNTINIDIDITKNNAFNTCKTGLASAIITFIGLNWKPSTAITKISFVGSGAQFAVGTHMLVLGVK